MSENNKKLSLWQRFRENFCFASRDNSNRYYPFRKINKRVILTPLKDILALKYKKQPTRWRRRADSLFYFDNKKQTFHFPYRKDKQWVTLDELKDYDLTQYNLNAYNKNNSSNIYTSSSYRHFDGNIYN